MVSEPLHPSFPPLLQEFVDSVLVSPITSSPKISLSAGGRASAKNHTPFSAEEVQVFTLFSVKRPNTKFLWIGLFFWIYVRIYKYNMICFTLPAGLSICPSLFVSTSLVRVLFPLPPPPNKRGEKMLLTPQKIMIPQIKKKILKLYEMLK